MNKEINGFLTYIGTERGLSTKTVDAYRYDLGKFSEFVDKELGSDWKVENIDQYIIRGYMQFLADKGYKKANSAVARGRKLAVLKSFFRWLSTEGNYKVDIIKIKMPKVTQKEPSYLTEQEYKRLIKTVKKTSTAYFKARDLAIISILLGIGLRLSELTGLNIIDINFDDSTVKVMRKGNQQRILPVSDDVLIAIKRYLDTREKRAYNEPLFLSKRNERINNSTVWYMVKKYLKQAQIEKDKLSPHTLRHTFATTLLKKGENILTIKELLSHKNLRTTERYMHINNEDLKSAVAKIDLAVI